MRATAAAGREVFGYNRSVEGAQGAVADGFDATTELTDTLTRAADTGALIVLAVPMPALPSMLAHISELAPDCPLTDVTSVKERGARRGRRGRSAGTLRRRSPDDRHRELGLGRRARRVVHQGPVGGQRGRPRGPGGVVDGDDVGAGLRRGGGAGQVRRARRRGGRHLASAAPARRGAGGHRRRGPAGLRAGRRVVPRRHPGGRQPPRTWCARCAKATPASCCRRSTGSSTCSAAPATRWPAHNSVAELVEAGHAARTRYDSFPRSDIFTVVIGEENWREELAAAGRAGGVIRSALPILDSPR